MQVVRMREHTMTAAADAKGSSHTTYTHTHTHIHMRNIFRPNKIGIMQIRKFTIFRIKISQWHKPHDTKCYVKNYLLNKKKNILLAP